jgi:2-iminobutanoate/2-iminopropanoate deaminase
MFKIIQTQKAPPSIGHYSQAIMVDDFIFFCSGQIGVEPQTGQLVEGIEKQTEQVLKNLEAVLAEAGVSFKNVVKTTVYLKNIVDFPKMNEIYAKFFGEHKPARSAVEVANLPKGALIEIEAIAVKG